MGSSPAQVTIDWKLLLCAVFLAPSDCIVFPADESPHHIKLPLDLKFISNFAGSLPTERSGWEVTVKTRIPPSKAGGVPGAQAAGRGNVAGQQVVLASAFQNTQLRWLGRGLQSSGCWWSSTICKYKNCSQLSPVRRDSRQANSPERDRYCKRWETAQSWAASPAALPAERLGKAVGNSERDQTGDPHGARRTEAGDAPWAEQEQGSVGRVTYRINFVARYCQGGRWEEYEFDGV